LRVEAGKHFRTDVLTGAVVGSAVGLLIPYLHRRALPAGGPAFASRLRFSAAPLALVNGGGVLLTIE
jgi:membrane-associated phospholipid phosphatase